MTELPYFSVMEFGGGPPRKYAMRCLPQADADADETNDGGDDVGADRRRAQESAPDQMGPVAIQRCSAAAAGVEMLWVRNFVFCGPPSVCPPPCAPPSSLASTPGESALACARPMHERAAVSICELA